jgi:hypothetical protein
MATVSIAEISAVPAPYRGKVLTASAKLIENGLYLFQFVLLLVLALVPALLGGLAATARLFPNNNALSFAPVIVGLALSGLSMWFLCGWMMKKPWSADYLFRRTQAALARRPDALADSNNPDAIFAEIIPRRNWRQLALNNAEDLGLLVVDGEGRQLIFEGDNKRYRIPAAALLGCNVELMNPDAQKDARDVPIGLVVVMVRDHLGEREVPLRPVRTVGGDPMGADYIERAHELQRRILSLIDAGARHGAIEPAGVA